MILLYEPEVNKFVGYTLMKTTHRSSKSHHHDHPQWFYNYLLRTLNPQLRPLNTQNQHPPTHLTPRPLLHAHLSEALSDPSPNSLETRQTFIPSSSFASTQTLLLSLSDFLSPYSTSITKALHLTASTYQTSLGIQEFRSKALWSYMARGYCLQIGDLLLFHTAWYLS